MPEAVERRFDEIVMGDEAMFDVVLTEALVDQFAALSGDYNPLHMDEGFAQQSTFKGRVVHGFVGASFFSRLVGMHLPGVHALYLSQKILFRSPMRIGMKVSVRGKVVGRTEAARTITIQTQVIDTDTGTCCVDGEAIVRVLA